MVAVNCCRVAISQRPSRTTKWYPPPLLPLDISQRKASEDRSLYISSPLRLMAILRLMVSLKTWSCFSFCGEGQSHMRGVLEREKTHRAPSGAGRTPAQALNVQSQAGIAGTAIGEVLPLITLLSSYPARVAPKPVAAAIRARLLL